MTWKRIGEFALMLFMTPSIALPPLGTDRDWECFHFYWDGSGMWRAPLADCREIVLPDIWVEELARR